MSEIVCGFVGIAILLLLILLGLPIGLSFIIIGAAGIIYLNGLDSAFYSIGSTVFSWGSNYTFAAIPLFILMGHFTHNSGISRDLYDMGHKWIGKARGGLAMATVMACGGFAALSGSSLATAAAMGKVSLPEMQRYQYKTPLATGTVAAGGTIGILIPPSIPLIIYGLLTEESISELFMAGLLPGILQIFLYCSVIYIICILDPKAGPAAPQFSLKERMSSLVNAFPMFVIFIMVMGSIYSGIATPTEAASIGVLGSFIFIVVKKLLTCENFISTLVDTGTTTAMLLTILIGAMIFSTFLSITGLPIYAAEWIMNLEINRYLILSLILGLYIPLGCIMDSLAMIVLTIPLFFPTLKALGFSPILIGILAVRLIEIGQITPPVGLNVFVIRSIMPKISLGVIFRGIIPFFICDLINVAILVAVPQISLWLPGLIG